MALDHQQQLREAIKLLTAAGAVIALPSQRHLSLRSAAAELDCGVSWLREHMAEFPNAWRMPGGELRVPSGDVAEAKKRIQLGELRIPSRDIEALAKRCRVHPRSEVVS